MHTRKLPLVLMLTLTVLLATGCDLSDPGQPASLPDEDPALTQTQAARRGAPLREQADIFITTGLTVDADGNTVVPAAADPATPLYYRRTRLPVRAPDRHHVTAGEFAAADGTAEATCLRPGTQVQLHLRGLIPHALYRIWILTFQEPGFDIGPPLDFSNLIGQGALGPNDRSRNSFTASASGQGTIVRFVPEGALSEFGSAEECLLSDVFEWHVYGAFQQPGQPAGPDVGPPDVVPESAVEQFVFVFRQ